MFREVEANVWQHRDSGWMCNAPDVAEAERLYAEHVERIEAENRRHEQRHHAKYLAIPEYVPILSGVKRKLPASPFRLPIDNARDLEMRLRGSVIYVGPEPVTVEAVFALEGDLWLYITDAEGKNYRVKYNHPKVDCRTADPKYLVYNHRPFYFLRYPSRHQKQGMDSTNTSLKAVGEQDVQRVDSLRRLCEALTDLPTLEWTPQYSDLMVKAKAFRSLRLSSDVAFFVRDGLCAEYKGRELGAVHDNDILLDENDFAQPWIKEEILKIGCQAKRV